MIDASFLDQLGRFDIILKKKVHTQFAGERSSSNIGDGLVFSDYREYMPGDDFRQIDWSLYARSNKYFIKRYEEEKNMTLHILLDSSASMDFGKKITKFEYGAKIGLGFSFLSIKANERFDFATFSDKMDLMRPKKGKNALLEILDVLNHKKVKGESNFYNSLSSFKKQLKSKSIIVLISDFLFDTKELEESLKLFRKSQVYVIQVLDPEELKFNMAGDLVLKDSERGNIIKTFISNRLRNMYRNKMDVHIAEMKKTCSAMNAKFMSVTTDQEIFDTFYKIIRN